MVPFPEQSESIQDRVDEYEDDSSDEDEEDEDGFEGFTSARLSPEKQKALEYLSLQIMMSAAVFSERVTDPNLGFDQRPSVFEFSEDVPEAGGNAPHKTAEPVVQSETETTPDFVGFDPDADLPSLGLDDIHVDPESGSWDFEGFGMSSEVLRILSADSSRAVPSFVIVENNEGSDVSEPVCDLSQGFYIDDEMYNRDQ